MALARPSAAILFALVALAFVCLALAFVGNDFSVLYVATNSNRSLPTHYRFAAVWGGHEGSMLLWTLMLAVWTVAVARFSAHLPDKVMARILAVMGWLVVRLPALHADDLEPVRPAGADARPTAAT